MAELKFKSRVISLHKYETVLDALLRHGEAIPYACKAGMCQACLIRAVDCEATPESRKWIKPALQAKGYTLACQWVPEQDVEAALPTLEEFSVPLRIEKLTQLNDTVCCVQLAVTDPALMFSYRPGQYLSLINPQGVIRSYSIANDYERDGFLELHISKTTQGIFTGWLQNEASVGMELHMRGPAGDCFYSDIDGNTHPLVLAGTGTGLAPLYGIACDALRQGHTGPIHLHHGGRTTAQLYYVSELQALARHHSNFFYHPVVMEASPQDQPDFHEGRLEHAVEASIDSTALRQTHAYLCGAPDFVYGMRKRLYLKGIHATNIHCDPFTERMVAS